MERLTSIEGARRHLRKVFFSDVQFSRSARVKYVLKTQIFNPLNDHKTRSSELTYLELLVSIDSEFHKGLFMVLNCELDEVEAKKWVSIMNEDYVNGMFDNCYGVKKFGKMRREEYNELLGLAWLIPKVLRIQRRCKELLKEEREGNFLKKEEEEDEKGESDDSEMELKRFGVELGKVHEEVSKYFIKDLFSFEKKAYMLRGGIFECLIKNYKENGKVSLHFVDDDENDEKVLKFLEGCTLFQMITYIYDFIERVENGRIGKFLTDQRLFLHPVFVILIKLGLQCCVRFNETESFQKKDGEVDELRFSSFLYFGGYFLSYLYSSDKSYENELINYFQYSVRFFCPNEFHFEFNLCLFKFLGVFNYYNGILDKVDTSFIVGYKKKKKIKDFKGDVGEAIKNIRTLASENYRFSSFDRSIPWSGGFMKILSYRIPETKPKRNIKVSGSKNIKFENKYFILDGIFYFQRGQKVTKLIHLPSTVYDGFHFRQISEDYCLTSSLYSFEEKGEPHKFRNMEFLFFRENFLGSLGDADELDLRFFGRFYLLSKYRNDYSVMFYREKWFNVKSSYIFSNNMSVVCVNNSSLYFKGERVSESVYFEDDMLLFSELDLLKPKSGFMLTLEGYVTVMYNNKRNFRFDSAKKNINNFSKEYQNLIITLLYLLKVRKPKNSFFLISHDVLFYKIIPYLTERDVFFARNNNLKRMLNLNRFGVKNFEIDFANQLVNNFNSVDFERSKCSDIDLTMLEVIYYVNGSRVIPRCYRGYKYGDRIRRQNAEKRLKRMQNILPHFGIIRKENSRFRSFENVQWARVFQHYMNLCLKSKKNFEKVTLIACKELNSFIARFESNFADVLLQTIGLEPIIKMISTKSTSDILNVSEIIEKFVIEYPIKKTLSVSKDFFKAVCYYINNSEKLVKLSLGDCLEIFYYIVLHQKINFNDLEVVEMILRVLEKLICCEAEKISFIKVKNRKKEILPVLIFIIKSHPEYLKSIFSKFNLFFQRGFTDVVCREDGGISVESENFIWMSYFSEFFCSILSSKERKLECFDPVLILGRISERIETIISLRQLQFDNYSKRIGGCLSVIKKLVSGVEGREKAFLKIFSEIFQHLYNAWSGLCKVSKEMIFDVARLIFQNLKKSFEEQCNSIHRICRDYCKVLLSEILFKRPLDVTKYLDIWFSKLVRVSDSLNPKNFDGDSVLEVVRERTLFTVVVLSRNLGGCSKEEVMDRLNNLLKSESIFEDENDMRHLENLMVVAFGVVRGWVKNIELLPLKSLVKYIALHQECVKVNDIRSYSKSVSLEILKKVVQWDGKIFAKVLEYVMELENFPIEMFALLNSSMTKNDGLCEFVDFGKLLDKAIELSSNRKSDESLIQEIRVLVKFPKFDSYQRKRLSLSSFFKKILLLGAENENERYSSFFDEMLAIFCDVVNRRIDNGKNEKRVLDFEVSDILRYFEMFGNVVMRGIDPNNEFISISQIIIKHSSNCTEKVKRLIVDDYLKKTSVGRVTRNCVVDIRFMKFLMLSNENIFVEFILEKMILYSTLNRYFNKSDYGYTAYSKFLRFILENIEPSLIEKYFVGDYSFRAIIEREDMEIDYLKLLEKMGIDDISKYEIKNPLPVSNTKNDEFGIFESGEKEEKEAKKVNFVEPFQLFQKGEEEREEDNPEWSVPFILNNGEFLLNQEKEEENGEKEKEEGAKRN